MAPSDVVLENPLPFLAPPLGDDSIVPARVPRADHRNISSNLNARFHRSLQISASVFIAAFCHLRAPLTMSAWMVGTARCAVRSSQRDDLRKREFRRVLIWICTASKPQVPCFRENGPLVIAFENR